MVEWTRLSNLLTQLVDKYSGIIRDKELHRDWDIGQAVCRGTYGKDWSNNEQYKKDNASDKEPSAAIAVAEDWLKNGLPIWAKAI
jgi:hypothetical protein